MRDALVFSAEMSGTLFVIMLVFLRAHHRHPGFPQWTAGTGLVCSAFLFLGLRGLIPEAVSVPAVNASLLVAAPMFLDGTRRFLGQARLRLGWYALASIPFGGCLYYLLVNDNIAARTAILMVAAAIPFAASVALVGKERAAARSPLFTALAVEFALLTAAMLVRAGGVLRRPGVALLIDSPSQLAFFGASVVLHLGVTVTFILLTTERVAGELAEANRLLAKASRTDALTGLANRRAFLEVAEAEVRRMARTRRPFSLILADIDGFKRINDELGHAAGDGVLCEVAARVRAAVRKLDATARWGGEEFVFLLPETTMDGAVRAAESVRSAISATSFAVEDSSFAITMSFGVAEHVDGRTIDATMAVADRALYRAKNAGRDRVVAGQP